MPDPADLASLTLQHKWTLLAAVLIGLIVRLLKDDTRFPTVPARARIPLVAGLGVAAAVLERVAAGTSWHEAALHGAFAAVLSILGHEALIESARKGQEIPLPQVLLAPKKVAPKVPAGETGPTGSTGPQGSTGPDTGATSAGETSAAGSTSAAGTGPQGGTPSEEEVAAARFAARPSSNRPPRQPTFLRSQEPSA